MPPHAAPAADGGLPPIVLLVERDRDTLEMYATALDLGGFWVAEAGSGSDAFEYAQELRPDVIITDVRGLGRDEGVELATRLRAEPRTADTPIIALSDQELGPQQERSDIFDDVLLKPVAPGRIIAHIREVLERSRELKRTSQVLRDRVPQVIAHSQEILSKSQGTITRSERAIAQALSNSLPCPRCGAPMAWAERREMEGVLYDYYRPCPSGCGLYCYDHLQGRLVTLID